MATVKSTIRAAQRAGFQAVAKELRSPVPPTICIACPPDREAEVQTLVRDPRRVRLADREVWTPLFSGPLDGLVLMVGHPLLKGRA